MFPIGALIIALWRNLIGVRTFGTFMPLLISLALRNAAARARPRAWRSVIVLGIFRGSCSSGCELLLVPRLGVLLCIVVLRAITIALAARAAG